jgi:hypothetical protein
VPGKLRPLFASYRHIPRNTPLSSFRLPPLPSLIQFCKTTKDHLVRRLPFICESELTFTLRYRPSGGPWDEQTIHTTTRAQAASSVVRCNDRTPTIRPSSLPPASCRHPPLSPSSDSKREPYLRISTRPPPTLPYPSLSARYPIHLVGSAFLRQFSPPSYYQGQQLSFIQVAHMLPFFSCS